MNCTGVQGLTEHEFFTSLNDREEIEQCAGPIIYLKLSEQAASILLAATKIADHDDIVKQAYVARVNDTMALFGSCMAHWIDMSAISIGVGSELRRPDFVQLAEKLFVYCCNQAGWDWKELDNFLHNLDFEEEDSLPD